MTLTAYLAQRGAKAKALTKREADLLGIPFPLQGGWPRKYGQMEIEEDIIAQLAAHAEAARQAAKEKATRSQIKPSNAAHVSEQLSLAMLSAPASISLVPGFVLRRARRFRKVSPSA